MTLPKTVLIGGIATITVIAGLAFTLDKSPNQSSLLDDYQNFLEEIQNTNTKTDLLASCENSQKFAEQIQTLEDKLDTLTKRKNDLINATTEETTEEEWIPPIPGSEPLELSGDDYSSSTESSDIDYGYIPPIPGSEPLELSGDDYSPPIESSDIDYGYIPPIPGSEPLELSGDDYSSSTESSDIDYGYIPPIPGSEPLDLTPMPDTENSKLLNEINTLEEQITKELNNLKSLCDEEKTPEIISTSCVDACNKYSDCAGYTEGSTDQDQKDAYDSCMIECATWSDETKICINKKEITDVSACTNLSICALAEYSNVFK